MASSTQRSKISIAAAIITVLVIFVLGFLIGYFTSPKRSSDSSSSDDDSCKKYGERRQSEEKKKEAFHDQLYDSLDAKEIGKNLKYFSQRPHIGGTQRTKALADEIKKRWLQYGFDKVELPKYNVLLPSPDPDTSNVVQILRNGLVEKEFSGKIQIVDKSENDSTLIAPLLGYAKPGEVNGTLLYVNYGTKQDFDYLKNTLGIADCNGSIVIMRYGKIYRGNQVKNAYECGASGVILYTDPAYYAPFGENRTFPNDVWLPKTAVERGTILEETGDPLTLGLPAIDGIYRIAQTKANLPRIPATPMPYSDAVHILELMEGKDVPASWHGGLNIPYKLGDKGLKNNRTIRLKVNAKMSRLDTYNVIGTIYGREEPDRWVLIGNHRDAWGFGAVDASSGTSAMMEISRVMKKLLDDGWRPRRTIKFCSWGAEEAGLIGSTEWVEENEKALMTKAITYINIDIAAQGNYSLDIFGSPLLETLAFNETKKVDDPHGKTVYDRWLEVEPSTSDAKMPDYGRLDAGSDYAALYHFTGVPSLDMGYFFFNNTFYPVYHTIHDTYKWLQGLIDPNFVFHLTTTRVAARFLLNVADSFALPLDVSRYAMALNEAQSLLKQSYGTELGKHNVTLAYIEQAIQNFQIAAESFEKKREDAITSKSDIELRSFNDKMVNVEKAFIYSRGLPNRPRRRHVMYAPSSENRYGTTSFPGITELMKLANKTEETWDEIKLQVSIVYKAILEASHVLLADAM